MARREDSSTNPSLTQPPFSPARFAAHLRGRLHEVNERCIELLVQAGLHEETPTFEFIAGLRPLLRQCSLDAQRRAAQRSFLLVDLAFQHIEWWRAIKERPDRPRADSVLLAGNFPRPAAIALTRAALNLAWTGVHADREAACMLLGMARPVAEVIATLRFIEIDRIAERQFRQLRPRWEDRPATWHTLIHAAQANDANAMRDFNLHGLQLLAAELLTADA